MNTTLQIGLGLLLGAGLTIALLLKRKAFSIPNIILSSLLAVCCFGCLCIGIWQVLDRGTVGSRLSKEEMLSFANALFAEGAYKDALDAAAEYGTYYGYDDECRKLEARVYLAQGDYSRAEGLYQYLADSGNTLAEEAQFAADKNNSSAGELAVLDYLEGCGKDIGEYGFTPTSRQEMELSFKKDTQQILSDVVDSVRKEYAADGGKEDCAKAIYAVSSTYGQPEAEEGENVEASSKYRRAFDMVRKENPDFFSLDCVKKAYLKANVLSGDFGRITERLDEFSSYHELMVAAELYMGNFVRRNNFPDNFQDISMSDASAVSKQMQLIYSHSDGASIQEKKKLKERVDAVSAQMKDPTLSVLRERLVQAEETEAGTDRTKVCLELAKIDHYFQNETSSDQYLNEAIYCSQDCGDYDYAFAMKQIIDIIHNDDSDESENIKNVSEYVQTVLDHSLTVDAESILSSGKSAGQEDDIEIDTDIQADDAEELHEVERSSQKDVADDFAQAAVDYVSRAKSVVSIGKIDTSAFEHITARIQVSDGDAIQGSIQGLEKSLQVYDCGAKIDRFSLSKITYSASNILLCCDVSGSMEESIQDLRDAVTTFINDKNPKENISIVEFDDSIIESKPFGTSDEELLAMADGMSTAGGTDIFSAVVNSLESFSSRAGENNVLILMTDGQDNDPKSINQIYEEIGSLAEEKNTAVYTLGLGSEVDTAYLETIAAGGNGDFVYVSDSASLESFYEMLHGQMYQQYELSYDAVDTMAMSDRLLEVILPSRNAQGSKTYSLYDWDSEDNMDGEDDESGKSDKISIMQGLSVTGMSPRRIYKGQQNVDVKLKGTGFLEDMKASIKLNGNIDYTLEAKYMDEKTYQVTIPSSIAVGQYNVEVTINGKKAVLKNGFTVLTQENEQKTAFGPYVFTSAEKIHSTSGAWILRGGVQMNGWLCFKGDVLIDGDIEEGNSVTVQDMDGSYVDYDETVAEGFAHWLAEKGAPLDLPALETFHLYNDPLHLYDYENYQVEQIATDALKICQIMNFDTPSIRLYPDCIQFDYSTGTTALPDQDTILNANLKRPSETVLDRFSRNETVFKLKFDGSARITNKKVGLVIDAAYGSPDENEFKKNKMLSLFNQSVYSNGSVRVKIDTIKEEYLAGAMIRFAFLAKQSGVGVEIEWKKLSVDSVKFTLDLSQGMKVSLPGIIPIEANNFRFTVSGIKKALENKKWANLQIKGELDLSSGKIKEYFPKAAKHLGTYADAALFVMPDTSASIQFNPIKLEANAHFDLFGFLTLMETEFKIGFFEYTNELLNLDSEEVGGLCASVKTGLSGKTKNEKFRCELTGNVEASVHSRFAGLTETGTFKFNIDWWMVHMEHRKEGKASVGLYTTHDGKKEFVVAYKYKDKKGKMKGEFYYVDEDWNFGKDKGFLKSS